MKNVTNFAMAMNDLKAALAEYAGAKSSADKTAAVKAVDGKVLKAAAKLCETYGIDAHWLFMSDGASHKAFIGSDGIDFLVDFFASNKVEDVAAFCTSVSYSELKAKSIETEVEAAGAEDVVTEVATDEATVDAVKATEVVEAESCKDDEGRHLDSEGRIIADPGAPEIEVADGNPRFRCIRSGKTGAIKAFYTLPYAAMRRMMGNKAYVLPEELRFFTVHFSAVEMDELGSMVLLSKVADLAWRDERELEERRAAAAAEKAWKKFCALVLIGTAGMKWKGVEAARCAYEHDTVVPLADMRVPGLPEILARNNGKVPTDEVLRKKFLCCPVCQANEEPINRDGDLQIDDKSKMQTLQQANKALNDYVLSLAKDKGLIKR